MKQILTLMAVLPFSISALAQKEIDPHMYRAGDGVLKKRITYMKPGQRGQGVVWDFSDINVINERSEVTYGKAPDVDDVIVGKEGGNTLNYYTCRGDTLLMLGYENKTMRAKYGRPKALMLLPVKYGDRIKGVYHGTGAYSERIMMRMFGSYETETDAMGTVILPGNDTIRNVVRVHERDLASAVCLPDIDTEKELKAYVDSMKPFNADSINLYLSADSFAIATEKYLWYAEGYRYPIIETIMSGIKGKSPQYMTAYYCPPQEQEYLLDEVNAELRKLQGIGGYNNGFTGNGSLADGCMPEYEISVNNGCVEIIGTVGENTNVKVLVCDISGIVYKSAESQGSADGKLTMSVDCGNLRKGEYVLYINNNGIVIANKIKL